MSRKRPTTTGAALIAEFGLRMTIIDAHNLGKEIARDEAMQRDEPERWRQREAERLARNREQSELNRKLRAAGCQPMAPQLSFKQKMKKLQQLEKRIRAETATFLGTT